MRYGRAFDADNSPRLVEPVATTGRTLDVLLDWIASERAWLDDELLATGGILLRGFAVDSPEAFERVCSAVAPELMSYVGGESPRHRVSGQVYTSTEYAAELGIALHSEMSYAKTWPQRIFFGCMQPAERGGETPIADTRAILKAMDPSVADRFARLGVTYVSRYKSGWGLGRSWQEAFETEDRVAVEAILRADDVRFEWTERGELATVWVRPGVVTHPRTDERVWFNQADRWHVTARGPELAARLLRLMGEAGLPRHAYYGDGSAIDTEDLDHVREVLRSCELAFQWQRGDLLILDNVLIAHGRRPYEGERLTLTAMG